MLRQQPNTKL